MMTDKLTDAEIKELQEKKKQIHDELYDQVKEEMFKASSALEPEIGIKPDAWVIVEIQDPIHPGMPPRQKILSGWSGSYLYGDSWRMSSHIKEMNIKVNQDFYTVTTESGSTYTLFKSRQGLRMSNAGIYNELKERFGDRIEIVEL
jgi:hypothetical protein